MYRVPNTIQHRCLNTDRQIVRENFVKVLSSSSLAIYKHSQALMIYWQRGQLPCILLIHVLYVSYISKLKRHELWIVLKELVWKFPCIIKFMYINIDWRDSKQYKIGSRIRKKAKSRDTVYIHKLDFMDFRWPINISLFHKISARLYFMQLRDFVILRW